MGAAILIIALVVSGFGLAGLMPDPVASLLGGHLVFDTTHTLFGFVFSIALMLLPPLMPTRTRCLVRDVTDFHRPDIHWPLAFLRFSLHPERRRPAHHKGRFDPAQRVIFLGLGISLVLLVVSGLVLSLIPPSARVLLAWAVRIHIFATVMLLVCASIHVLAGSGLLPTHRGVTRAMFGSGRVRLSLARRLWPQWARIEATESDLVDPDPEVGTVGGEIVDPSLEDPP
ncbi:MAG: cytochrome b/b6 domain-containing protein [Micrococcales bacterium]|nr:cytochrome b/b6 domain-containing protein [Micrococcales bacterium]